MSFIRYDALVKELLTLAPQGYGSRFVRLVCLSVTTLAATYLVFKLKSKCHWASRGDFFKLNVWIFLKTLCSKVMATFADRLGLLHFLANSRCTKDAAMTSFQLE